MQVPSPLKFFQVVDKLLRNVSIHLFDKYLSNVQCVPRTVVGCSMITMTTAKLSPLLERTFGL